MKESIFKFDTKTVVALGIGSALYGVLGVLGFPIGPNLYIKPALAILVIFSTMFGPVVGFIVGFIGHVISDAIAGFGIWWGWVLADAIIGLFSGLVFCKKDFNLKNGLATKKHMIYLGITGTIGMIIGISIAGLFDVYVMNEPVNKIIFQVVWGIVADVAVLLVIGIPVVLAFIKHNSKNSNLKLNQ